MAADYLWLAASFKLKNGEPLPAAAFGRAITQNQKAVIISVLFDMAALKEEWDWISTSTAAEILKVQPARVRKLVLDGILQSQKRGRDVYVRLDEVEARAANNPGPGNRSKAKRERAAA
jgi:hypothetical protein